jgi:hypothetical protein
MGGRIASIVKIEKMKTAEKAPNILFTLMEKL